MTFRARFLPAFLACALLAPVIPSAADAEERDRNLEPVPPKIVFASREGRRPDDKSSAEMARKEIARSFASLGSIRLARERLVYRFGLICAPHLEAVLLGDNVTPHWNASLTVAALRSTYGPALELNRLLPPLAKKLTPQAGDFHTPAFAALAVGCFPWSQAMLPSHYAKMEGRYEAVPGSRRSVERAIRALTEARASLLRRVDDPQNFLRVSALLALAKMGGPKARLGVAAMKPPPQNQFHPTEQRQAELIARALLEVNEPKPYLTALRDSDRRVRAAGALAISVALLTESPAGWTKNADAFLPILRNEAALTQEDGRAEAAFARGLYALRAGDEKAWNAVWSLAKMHTSEDRVAEAAAQALLFRRGAAWEKQVIEQAGNSRTLLKEPVLAMLLLRSGEIATEKAIEACEKYLKSKSQRPAPDYTWDPRWYAVVGLLRSLHEGRIKSKALRARVIATLERAVDKVLDKKSVFRDELEAVLAAHGSLLAEADETSLYKLPLEDVHRVERSFRCPCALFSLDPVDACVHRVNALVHLMFGLDGIKPAKPGEPVTDKQPERYLRHYLEEFPYFTRLDFRDDRGWRPRTPPPTGDPKVIDR